MNKLHLQWLFKPAWQLCLWQLAISGTIVLLISLLVLRTTWMTVIAGRNEIITRQSTIEQYRQQLWPLPTLVVIQQQINDVLMAQKKCCANMEMQSLLQRIDKPVSVSGGRLLAWQDKEPVVENNLTQRRGHLIIEINYSGLVHFLRMILSLQPPAHIEQMSISVGQRELTVEFELAEYLWGSNDEPI